MAQVTSSKFMKTPGVFQDQAQSEPVIVTKHSREHTVLISAREYRRLKRRDREVLRVDELAQADIDAIAAARAPAEAAMYNDEYNGGGD